MSNFITSLFIKSPGYQDIDWKPIEKKIFRFFSVYLLVMLVPLDWNFYKLLLSINWLQIGYADLFNIAHYVPSLISEPPYIGWLIAAITALVAAGIWERNEKKTGVFIHYERLHYFIRVLVRYRLAIALFAYGFIKIFPLQFSYPSISQLNTRFGDFTDWKLFMLSIGIVPSYETFLGLVEVITAFLLLNRKTASIGAFVAIFFLGNVFFTLLAYNGGEAAYCFFLLILSLFVFANDARRLYSLVVLEKQAQPATYKPSFASPRVRYSRWILKGLIVFIFAGVYGFQTHRAYLTQSYQYPNTTGLKNVAGIYNVSEFRINDQLFPYSTTDSLRWRNVVFEKWNTISIASHRHVIIDSTNVERLTVNENDKPYELEGASGRHYYSYAIDSTDQHIVLQNKNKHYPNEKLDLKYSTVSDSRILLWGTDENENQIYAVLDKLPKRYLLEESKKTSRRGNKGIKI